MNITLPWIMLVSSMAFFSVGSSAESPCTVSLPQKQDNSSCCIDLRQEDIRKNQMAYRLITQKLGIPFALVDLSEDQLQNIIEVDPFMRPIGISYKNMTVAVINAVLKYVKQELGPVDVGLTIKLLAQKFGIKEELDKLLALLGAVEGLAGFLSQIQSFDEYEELRTFLRNSVQKDTGQEFPSNVEPFLAVNEDLMSDKLFALQRLAGANPMTLQLVRINCSGSGGMDMTDLKRTLNPSFNWDDILEQVSEGGHLFVLRYPLCDDLPKQIDITSISVKREMQGTLSPIALFVSRTGTTDTDIFPVAIQMDYTPDSPVYTPEDGDDWTLAKLNVQTTDVIYGQMVEHLSKVHFIAEALCVSMKRHLADVHPLQQILKFHCREVMIPDVFGSPALLNPITGFTRLLFATGKTGAELLVQRAYHYTTWKVTDFEGNLKDRGMWAVPEYFPYRDDGKLIYEAINGMVAEYVSTYYESNGDVQQDTELQAFFNAASAEGTEAPDGGEGKIKGFPSSITNREQLEEVLTRIIWHVTGQHASVNYQLNDYVAFVPNMPFKSYRNKANPNESTFAVLPNKATATIQAALTLILSTLRCDELFDYGDQMIDEKGAQIVKSYFEKLKTDVTNTLETRNNMRLSENKLTYPYMLPKWVPNGIQT